MNVSDFKPDDRVIKVEDRQDYNWTPVGTTGRVVSVSTYVLVKWDDGFEGAYGYNGIDCIALDTEVVE